MLDPLRRLAKGRTTIMITHDLRLAAHADRVLTLTDGWLIGHDEPTLRIARLPPVAFRVLDGPRRTTTPRGYWPYSAT
ncbi:hypothetical protein LWC34_00125 [Kibdelosporangium philippinense]|uniref:Iron complex transport system ATP-binding protein n=1 Tax=Kibdelosporangium philippinense TaxID=211113 RepID=A0ABS8Z2W9_9PSEU|nr:hypothetical protein [Kibdelosporangium philippinense]MCE7001254.1 hypothetical protein [Kibdelosporangium philippinense]